MKKVLILFGKSDWRKSRPFGNGKYRYSYEYFYDLCKKNGIQMYRASYQWYDYRRKIFKHAWAFEETNGSWKRAENIKPDLVFDKTKPKSEQYAAVEKISRNYKVFNNPEFTKIIDNKLNTQMLFSEWSKKNSVIENNNDLENVIGGIKSDKVVLKPINQSGGDNVIIGSKKDVLKEVAEKKIKISNWIAQEFIDSSNGIPGVMKGVHDFRLVMANNEVAYAYYRKPAEGSLLANIAKGGTMEIVSEEKIPESVRPILEKSKEIFAGFNEKLYTIDLMFDQSEKPWVVELNSMPGMYFEPGQERTRKIFYERLLGIFNKIT